MKKSLKSVTPSYSGVEPVHSSSNSAPQETRAPVENVSAQPDKPCRSGKHFSANSVVTDIIQAARRSVIGESGSSINEGALAEPIIMDTPNPELNWDNIKESMPPELKAIFVSAFEKHSGEPGCTSKESKESRPDSGPLLMGKTNVGRSSSHKNAPIKTIQVQDEEDDVPAKNPSQPQPRNKRLKNVLTRIEDLDAGPFCLLKQAMTEKRRVKVWIRSAVQVRSICTGYVLLFDKHLNMALADVDETYKNPLLVCGRTKKFRPRPKSKKKKKTRQNDDKMTTDSTREDIQSAENVLLHQAKTQIDAQNDNSHLEMKKSSTGVYNLVESSDKTDVTMTPSGLDPLLNMDGRYDSSDDEIFSRRSRRHDSPDSRTSNPESDRHRSRHNEARSDTRERRDTSRERHRYPESRRDPGRSDRHDYRRRTSHSHSKSSRGRESPVGTEEETRRESSRERHRSSSRRGIRYSSPHSDDPETTSQCSRSSMKGISDLRQKLIKKSLNKSRDKETISRSVRHSRSKGSTRISCHPESDTEQDATTIAQTSEKMVVKCQTETVENVVPKETKSTFQTVLKRHINQLFIRGDNVVMVALID